MEVSCECNLGLEMQLKQKVLWEICAKFTKHHRWFIKYNTSGSLHCCVHWWEYLGFEIILNISSCPRTFVCPGRVIMCISPWNNKIFVPLISTLSSDVIRRPHIVVSLRSSCFQVSFWIRFMKICKWNTDTGIWQFLKPELHIKRQSDRNILSD